jgi:hypothetical protein
MASAVDIANTALSHIGADAVVTSLSPLDGSVEAGHCARFLPIARQAVLSAEYSWAFARKRVVLAELTNDSTEWAYKYQVPSDCLRTRKVLAHDVADTPERGTAKYEREGDALYTNQPEATLIYTRDVTDTTRYPADFVSALGMILAGYLAGPIIKGADGARLGGAWATRGYDAMRSAAANDANASKDTADYTPASITARA